MKFVGSTYQNTSSKICFLEAVYYYSVLTMIIFGKDPSKLMNAVHP